MIRRRRALATTLTVLALLPVAAIAVTAGSPGPSAGSVAGLSMDSTTDALERAAQCDLFAAFSWNGIAARGTFVQFGFSDDTGVLSPFTATNGSSYVDLINSVTVYPWLPDGEPTVSGPTFRAVGIGISIQAQDEPSTMLEYNTMGLPHTVTLRFPQSLANVTGITRSDGWPAATVSFTMGGARGRILLGAGILNVSGATVTAYMTASDLLVIKTVPGFWGDPGDRAALLDAFGDGRLVAELAMVSMAGGTWMQSASAYRLNLAAFPSFVRTSDAAVSVRSSLGSGGLILFAFDPATMPTDSSHRLVVTANGTPIPQAPDVLTTVYSGLNAPTRPSYVQLALNATVVVVYLPNLASADVRVSSVPAPTAGPQPETIGAALVAAVIVAYAAAYMFRRRDAE